MMSNVDELIRRRNELDAQIVTELGAQRVADVKAVKKLVKQHKMTFSELSLALSPPKRVTKKCPMCKK
jgi:hypothetical protein